MEWFFAGMSFFIFIVLCQIANTVEKILKKMD